MIVILFYCFILFPLSIWFFCGFTSIHSWSHFVMFFSVGTNVPRFLKYYYLTRTIKTTSHLTYIVSCHVSLHHTHLVKTLFGRKLKFQNILNWLLHAID
jgi:hypothetical protein